ncbi:hypothetical protein CLCR_11089 [Cladophialophora carrionii]|uniref:Uncharacterized protein n=1 Tax=Cladophialophora carrionii TaxID=86049 RepID=A0A1C1CZP3_9EURO|nr:hypothetical protein CLCR_11089 [Cladophialophora carrionii]
MTVFTRSVTVTEGHNGVAWGRKEMGQKKKAGGKQLTGLMGDGGGGGRLNPPSAVDILSSCVGELRPSLQDTGSPSGNGPRLFRIER